MNLQCPPFLKQHESHLAKLGFVLIEIHEGARQALYTRLGQDADYRVLICHVWQHDVLSVAVDRYRKNYSSGTLSKTRAFDGWVNLDDLALIDILVAVVRPSLLTQS